MFRSRVLREAIERLRSSVARHEAIRRQLQEDITRLHKLRVNAATEVIPEVELYVGALANSPREFDTSVSELKSTRFQGAVKRIETQASRTTKIGNAT